MRALFVVPFLIGCVDLPKYSEVTDLRVLAVRSEPAELLDGQSPAELRVEALVVDPTRGEEPVQLQWQLCPLTQESACAGFDDTLSAGARPLELLDGLTQAVNAAGACPLSDATRAGVGELQALLGELKDPRYLARYRGVTGGGDFEVDLAGGAPDRPFRAYDTRYLRQLAKELEACGRPAFDGLGMLPERVTDLHLLHLLRSPLDSALGVLPSVVLTARRGEQQVVAQKYVPLGWRDLRTPWKLIELFTPGVDFGVELCGEVATPGCLPVAPRAPNENPTFADVRWAAGETPRAGDDEGWVSLCEGCELELKRGEALRVLPVFTADSFEPYQGIVLDPKTSRVSSFGLVEDISVAWFMTAGELGDELTWPKTTRSLDTWYRAPADAAVERVTLWLVARDHRGGITWKTLNVRLW
ncbi:MAG: hypothetical protein JNK82_24620 [Myxococcaceae bacterium]|nr:hypothetical protein [Myxococcaceae bacterium]